MPHSDIWTKEQLLETRLDFEKPRTVREMFAWMRDENNQYDLIREASSLYPLNYSKIDAHPINLEKYSFSKIAEIDSQQLLEYRQKIIDNLKAIASQNTDIRENKKDTQEYRFQSSMGFDKQTHVINVDHDNYPELYEISKLFDLDYFTSSIQYQPPGSVVGRHVDFLDSMWWNFNKQGLDILDLPYNTITKSPDGYYGIRLMIALTNWEIGQVFGFEDHHWINWKTGDVVMFDWAHARHYTANSSYVPRIYLKISGITKNQEHWLFDNINQGKISIL
jgi:hypothetical protein